MTEGLPKDVAEELIEGGIELGGETRNVAVLFADIRGFSKHQGNETSQSQGP